GARAHDRGDAAVVHSTHVAAGRAAPSHRSTGGGDARRGTRGRGTAGSGGRRATGRAGARRGRVSRGGRDARGAASGARAAGRHRGRDAAVCETTRNLVPTPTTWGNGKGERGMGRLDAR